MVVEVVEGVVGVIVFGEGGVVEVFGVDAGGVGDHFDYVVELLVFCVCECHVGLFLLG